MILKSYQCRGHLAPFSLARSNQRYSGLGSPLGLPGSRWNPALSATRWERRLPGLARRVIRSNAVSRNAHSQTRATALVAIPRFRPMGPASTRSQLFFGSPFSIR
jgi:hypothetical protein